MRHIDYRFIELQEPEMPLFVDCHRCGIRLGVGSKADYCATCRNVMRRGRPHYDGMLIPEFQINLYTRSKNGSGLTNTIHALRESKVLYWHDNMYDDRAVLAYMLDLCGHLPHTMVTITNPGETLAHWQDDDDPDHIMPWIEKAIHDAQALAA